MRSITTIVITVSMSVICGQAAACTSFVDYSTGEAWYGMNFDWYPDQDILFRVETDMIGEPVFTMSFITGGRAIPTVGMTADGRFSTMQVTDAPWAGPDPSEGNAVIFAPFYALIYRGASMADLEEMAGNDTFSQYDDPPLHVLAADAAGSAMILEVGEDGNDVTMRNGRPFMVMTNFSVDAWAGRSPSAIEGCGADRYRIALYLLKDGLGRMNPDAGLAVLEAARNQYADSPTRASMVFDAGDGQVYIAVGGDFERIWVLDIRSGLLEGWRGDVDRGPLLVDSTGVTASRLASGD